MPQVIRPDAPRDARPAQGVVPAAGNAPDGAPFIGNDIGAPGLPVLFMPPPEQAKHVVPDRHVAGFLPRPLVRVRHPDHTRFDVHIGPAEPEKLARAYARPGRHAEHDDPLDMRGRRVVQQARLLDGRRRDALGFWLGYAQRYQRVGKQQARPYRPTVRRPQNAHAAVHGGLPHPALALHFAPGQHIVAGDAVRPAVAENGRQRFDMLRRRTPCGGVFQCPRIPLKELRDRGLCRRSRGHAPPRPAHQLPLADMHLGLYGFELPRLAFSRKALDALLAAPRITVPENPLPTAIFHKT